MLLIVEDEPGALRALRKVVGRYDEVCSARSVVDALQMIDEHLFRGAIMDVGLPDGSGLDVLTAIQERHPGMPALVLTGYDDHETISRVQVLGAQYLLKPWEIENVALFVRRALDTPYGMLKEVEQYCADHGLSKREGELLALAVTGTVPTALPQAMGVTNNTVKTLTRRMLQKVGAACVDDVVRRLRRRSRRNRKR